jgi:hypothetical protein
VRRQYQLWKSQSNIFRFATLKTQGVAFQPILVGWFSISNQSTATNWYWRLNYLRVGRGRPPSSSGPDLGLRAPSHPVLRSGSWKASFDRWSTIFLGQQAQVLADEEKNIFAIRRSRNFHRDRLPFRTPVPFRYSTFLLIRCRPFSDLLSQRRYSGKVRALRVWVLLSAV